VTFTNGAPTAAAVQMGPGAFQTASIQNGQTSFTLPAGTTSYNLAYVCPPQGVPALMHTDELVIEATVSDGTAVNASCQAQPSTGSATGSVDATAIPGVSNVLVVGNGGFGSFLNATHGSFNLNMPLGTNDIVVAAVDGSLNPLAVKVLRSQTVSGAVNGGNTIVLSASDEVTQEPLTINNAPANFIPPVVFVEYRTANGTLLNMRLSAATTYPAVPPAILQTGDNYFVECFTDDTATHNSVVTVNQIVNTAAPLTINLPPVWSPFSGPAATTFPTFSFNYSGFAASPNLSYQVFMRWATGASTENRIEVTATANFQNGSSTLSIPNLTSLPGFLPPAPSGTTVGYGALILDGQMPLSFLPSLADGVGPLVENKGSFVEP
jgi:hypothetical protein